MYRRLMTPMRAAVSAAVRSSPARHPPSVHRRDVSGGDLAAHPYARGSVLVPAGVATAFLTPGRELDPESRAYFQPRFAHDFSKVRVHTDDSARRSCAALDADAWTVGPHVFLGPRATAPSARHTLLSHELAHVVQQGGGSSRAALGLADIAPMRVSQPSDATEQDAARSSAVVLRGGVATPIRRVRPQVARAPAGRKHTEPAGGLMVGNYVDAFNSATYDIDFRSEHHGLSKWITLHYTDGAEAHVHIDQIGEETLPTFQLIQVMIDQATVGEGHRVFPSRMNRTSTPNLWAAKHAVLEIMDTYNTLFLIATFPTVFTILTIAAQPGGKPPRAKVRSLPSRTVRRGGAPQLEEPPQQTREESRAEETAAERDWDKAEAQRREQEGEGARSTGRVAERYKSVEAAIGQVQGQARLVRIVPTKNAGLRNQGFTETHYVVDSNGTQWTVAHNPRSGDFTGAHPSSSN
jgi:hypothetical protein